MTPWTAACQASLSITNTQNLLQLMSIESVMPSTHLTLCHPLLSPSTFPSIRVFSNESAICIRWPEDWSFSISPSNEYSGLILLKIDWFYLLAVQRTFKSLLQHHSLKASILWCSVDGPAFATVRDYWEDHCLDYMDHCWQSNVSVFNTLSGFVMAFLSRSNHLLTSWLHSSSTEILDSKKRKSVTASAFSPYICHEVMGPDAILVFYDI